MFNKVDLLNKNKCKMFQISKIKSNSLSSISQKLIQTLLLISIIIIIGLRIWGLNKGFNITDEAYAVLGFEPLQERLEVITAFHIIVYKLFGWLEPSLMAYRAIGQLLIILSASFFALGYYYWLNKIYKQENKLFGRNFILLFFILGGFLIDYDRYNALHYDIINNALNISQASLVLILIAQDAEKAIKSWKFKLGWLATGFLVAFQFFTKPPSALIFTILLAVLVILYQRNINRNYYFVVGGFFVLGGLLGLLSYFVIFQDFWQYQELLFRQLPGAITFLFRTSKTTNLVSKIVSIATNYKLIITAIGGSFATFGLTKIYFSLDASHTPKKSRLLKIFLGAVTVSLLLGCVEILGWHLTKRINITSGYPLIFIILLIILAAVFTEHLLTLKNSDHFWKIAAVSIFLFFLPFGAALGTNTPLGLLSARNIIPWLALMIILLIPLYQTQKINNFTYFFIFTFILWLAVKISYFYFYHPQGLVENRLQQTELVDFVQPHARGLKVDPPTAKFLEQLNTLVYQTDFQPGDPIIALDNMPGLVYLLGGVSPGAPWYFSNSDQRTCNNILYSSFEPSKAILLINSDLSPKLLGCLKTVGINFPEDYQKVGEVYNPWVPLHSLQRKTVAVWSTK